jgi:enterochelin esterase-like enzyme
MKYLFIFGSFCFQLAVAQPYALLEKFNTQLNDIRKAPEQERKKRADALWNSLQQQNIPLISHDSVYFLYNGPAQSVEWVGDFNGWGYQKEFNNKGKQVAGTDLWVLKCSFPLNARLDYKIIVDGSQWMLDPENHFLQWSGVGGGSPNSELRMPAWREDPMQTERANGKKGSIKTDILFNSKVLGYQITYSVYLPHHYGTEKLPVVYVTDGYEYLHPKMGNMKTVLDNLIEDQKIKPVIAVFVDHREPINRSNNRRMQELAMNGKYLDFFTQELITKIESDYAVIPDASARAIMGTSMGGLTAAYFAFAKPEVFGLAGIQSPSFYTKPQIYALCENPANPKMKISMTTGLIHDTSQESRKMKALLEANSCEYTYREVNEGHSWGNWRGLIDEILVDLFGTK